MIALLQTVGAFVLALAVLVAFHEYGHYRVARALGVKILRFSVGFGQPLFARRFGPDRTEFVLAAIPLGGYVKMLDEREGDVSPHDLHRAFNRQPVAVRAAIVAAGPLANFLLAFVVYWLCYMVGVTGPKPVVGSVAPEGMAATAGLRAGDDIVGVNGRPTAIWDNVLGNAIDAILDGEGLRLEVLGTDGSIRDVTLDFAGLSIDDVSRGNFFTKSGFAPLRPEIPAVIGRVVPGEPAAEAGLRAGDRLMAVGERAIEDWIAWVEFVRENPAKPLDVRVRRGAEDLVVRLVPRGSEEGGKLIGRIGAEVANPPAGASLPQGVERHAPLAAATRAVQRTAEVTLTTLKFLRQMIVGRASVENLSGPLSIAQFAGESAKLGLSRFLEFIGLVSVSLAVLNLLPVPMLDGGHLVFYLIEFLTRRPVPEALQIYGQQVGLFLLLGLMGLAIYNDLMRIF